MACGSKAPSVWRGIRGHGEVIAMRRSLAQPGAALLRSASMDFRRFTREFAWLSSLASQAQATKQGVKCNVLRIPSKLLRKPLWIKADLGYDFSSGFRAMLHVFFFYDYFTFSF